MNSDPLKCLIAFLFAGSLMITAQADELVVADKTDIQAAFLFNFGLFTDWPRLPDNEFRICVIADDNMLGALSAKKNKQIKNRSISIVKVDSLKNARSCQILFIGASAHALLKNVEEKLGQEPVLVVAEENSYDLREVIIALNEQQNRIGFKINRTEASKRSLTFSSRLLKLATQVY